MSRYHAYIENRVLEVANYMVETESSIREIAKKFGFNKSTIHNDLTNRLKVINPGLYLKIQKILAENKYLGVIKGGYATQKLWQQKVKH